MPGWVPRRATTISTLQAGVGWGLLPGAYAGGYRRLGHNGATNVAHLAVRDGILYPVRPETITAASRPPTVAFPSARCMASPVAICAWQLCPSFAAGVLWAEGRRSPIGMTERVIALVGLEIKGDLRIVGRWRLSLSGRADVPSPATKVYLRRRRGTRMWPSIRWLRSH